MYGFRFRLPTMLFLVSLVDLVSFANNVVFPFCWPAILFPVSLANNVVGRFGFVSQQYRFRFRWPMVLFLVSLVGLVSLTNDIVSSFVC